MWGGETTTLNLIVTSVFIGIMLASVAILYNKLYVGGLIRRLIDAGALSEETSRTLSSLGYKKASLIRFSLRKGSTLRKSVLSAGEAKDGAFYIPAEKKDELRMRYDKKGTNLVVFVVCACVLFFAAAAVIRYYPELSKKIGEVFSSETQA